MDNFRKEMACDYVLTGTFTQYCFWGILARIYSIHTSLHLEYWFFDARVILAKFIACTLVASNSRSF
jgi:hypothetical protein